jgi:class 3 adenylate cyclase/tetratricopeptide (TPR) repeat protein
MDLAASPERSIVSVLAVDTVDSTGHIAGIDPDDAQQLLDRIFEHLSGAITRVGGLIVSYAGDGGMAVFGWPNSQEDHADRACDAAWSIQGATGEVLQLRSLSGRPVQFRVGIHSGLVGLRRMTIGNDTRLDTVGGTVHLAAALQKNAPAGGILISSKTMELSHTELELTPCDLPALKRLNIEAYRLVGRPTKRRENNSRFKYQHEFVGRKAEREILRNILVRSSNDNRAIAIIGEPGIGKSRLAAAVLDEATVCNMPRLVSCGDSQKSNTPYAVIRSIMLSALSLGDTASDDDVNTALEKAGIGEQTRRVLGTALLTKYQEPDTKTIRLTPTQVAREIILAFKTLTSGHPVLILVEDLHFLDPESVHCLRLLCKERDLGFRTLIVTGRPESIPEARGIADTVLRLSPLPRTEMKELALRTTSKGFTESVIETVLDRADGIPFVLEQIMLSIAAVEVMNVNLLPQTVQSVIHARLNRLPSRTKLLVQGLSVLGNEVEIDFALKTLSLDREALQQDRLELERLEILDSDTGNFLRFHHAIVSEACLETVPGPRREELHRSAIKAITSTHADLEVQFERLAFHAEGAQDNEKAIEYLWLAALSARRRSASGSLDLMFRRAMRLIDRIGEAAEPRFVDFVLMAFGSLAQIGEFRRLGVYLPRALALARKQNRQSKVCAALCHLGLVSWFEARYAEGREQSERALDIANELNSLPLIFAAKFNLASALYGTGALDEAIAAQRDLCAMLTGDLETSRLGAAGIPGSIVRSFLCWFLTEVGGYEEGLNLVERAIDIARAQREPYSELLALLAKSRNLIRLERYSEAITCLEHCVVLIEQNGYDAILPHVLGTLASALARSGEGSLAVRQVEAWLNSEREDRSGPLELYYLNAGYAEALSAAGDVKKGLAVVNRAVEISRSVSNPCLIAHGLGLRARLRAEARDASGADSDRAEQRVLCSRFKIVGEV